MPKRFVFIGWKVGLNTIHLTKVLKSKTNMSLSKAKEMVERIIDGETVVITLDDQDADTLEKEISNIGVMYRVEDY